MITTDDSTNGKTIVDDSPTEITWTQWNNLTPEQQAAIPKALITDAPGVDGPINVELIKTLWTNPSPTSAFAAQNINLLNDEYDLLIFVGYYSTSYTAWLISSTCNKGHGTILHFSYNGTDFLRTVTRVSDSSFNIADGQKGYGQTVEIDNTVCVPVAIYGIKTSVTVDVSGVISDVSTSADKCMMSDGVTSVENKITANIFSGEIDVSSYSSDNMYTCLSDGYAYIVNNSSPYDGLARICDSTGILGISIGGGEGRFGIFVHKGMKIYTTGSPFISRFIPII